ncbi:MAG: AMP-binding protein, partial [Nitrospinaceae bacterium]|nr:AMP-binding protein [Nitrospinaceae bacterium]NIS84854.1 AMP-binding protein [Nitrospinaceae bacterium]NIT81665.1 AMP-binding protein [Nitrospinaceae bacterium]NIU45392.1 AMP-binding protein [Nitrospinaceae bacterium]NIU97546.1 AMP-binding protein [Nitrospinaceae bacterium]
AALNYAENLLRGPSEKTAIFSKAETRPLARMTFGELREEVARFAAALKQAGVNPGDRVAGLLPNIPETIVAMLGTAAVGGVWSSCSPDFGPQGVKDRFGQIEPKVLIAVDGYTYNGKPYPVLETVDAVAGQCPGLQRLVILPFLEDSVKKKEIHFPAVDTWAEWTRTSGVRTPDFQ